MVDRISGNSSYDYPNQKDARKSPAVQAYENTPGKKEAAKQKSGSMQSAGSRQHEENREQKGVILDLSSKAKKDPAAEQKTSWLAALRKIAAPVIASIAGWIKNFWESDTAMAGDTELAAAGMSGMESGTDSVLEDSVELPPLDEVNEIPDYESMIDDAVKSHDLHKVEQILTQNGAKHLAHHSDLLTYYDRRGKLVEIDDTAKHRVLFGDRNIMKL